MSLHYLKWTFEELGKNLGKSLDVEFECCVSGGSPGSYWEPPEPVEIEFCDVTIVCLANEGGTITLDPSWEKTIKDIAFELYERDRERLEVSLLEKIGSDVDDMEDYYSYKYD